MDFSDIKKIKETTNVNLVQEYLDKKEWRILAISPGRQEDGSAYHLYALGWSPLDEDGVTYI